jgi:hypothetical protein
LQAAAIGADAADDDRQVQRRCVDGGLTFRATLVRL